MVGDADLMGVLAEVLEDLLGTGKRSLRVHDPVLAKDVSFRRSNCARSAKTAQAPSRLSSPRSYAWVSASRNLPRKSGEVAPSREQAVLGAGEPTVAIRCETAARHCCSARGDGAEGRASTCAVRRSHRAFAQAFLVHAKVEQRTGRGREEHVEEHLPIAQSKRTQLVRQRGIRRGSSVPRTRPIRLSIHAAWGEPGIGVSMAIAARVVGTAGEVARMAHVHVAAENRGPAYFDRVHRGSSGVSQRVGQAVGPPWARKMSATSRRGAPSRAREGQVTPVYRLRCGNELAPVCSAITDPAANGPFRHSVGRSSMSVVG